MLGTAGAGHPQACLSDMSAHGLLPTVTSMLLERAEGQ